MCRVSAQTGAPLSSVIEVGDRRLPIATGHARRAQLRQNVRDARSRAAQLPDVEWQENPREFRSNCVAQSGSNSNGKHQTALRAHHSSQSLDSTVEANSTSLNFSSKL